MAAPRSCSSLLFETLRASPCTRWVTRATGYSKSAAKPAARRGGFEPAHRGPARSRARAVDHVVVAAQLKDHQGQPLDPRVPGRCDCSRRPRSTPCGSRSSTRCSRTLGSSTCSAIPARTSAASSTPGSPGASSPIAGCRRRTARGRCCCRRAGVTRSTGPSRKSPPSSGNRRTATSWTTFRRWRPRAGGAQCRGTAAGPGRRDREAVRLPGPADRSGPAARPRAAVAAVAPYHLDAEAGQVAPECAPAGARLAEGVRAGAEINRFVSGKAPPLATPDAMQAHDAAGHTAAQVPAASRNQPCPCGSGLRYKQCHGRFADGTAAWARMPPPGRGG